MLSCIDLSSPPSVTSLTYPTKSSGGDDTLVLRSFARRRLLGLLSQPQPFIQQRLRLRYLFRQVATLAAYRKLIRVEHVLLSSTFPDERRRRTEGTVCLPSCLSGSAAGFLSVLEYITFSVLSSDGVA